MADFIVWNHSCPVKSRWNLDEAVIPECLYRESRISRRKVYGLDSRLRGNDGLVMFPSRFNRTAMVWNNKFTVYVEGFDSEHKRIIGIINRMYEIKNRKGVRNTLGKILGS